MTMLQDKMSQIKNMFLKKTEGNNKKTIENLIVFIILLIVTIIAINSIWGNDNKKKTNTYNAVEEIAVDNIINGNNLDTNEYNLENELEDILYKISGVGKVDVMITYSETSKVVAMYDEKIRTSLTEEKDTQGAIRNIQESDTSKEVIMNEENNPITERIVMPTIEGAVVIAEGADNATVKTNIIQAVSAVTGLSTYKIQVFKMK